MAMSETLVNILLVEDEAAHAELIRRAFELDPSLHLRVVTNLADAEAQLTGGIPDLLIVDSSLPDGRGVDLLANLIEGPSGGTFPTVLLTSHHEPKLEKEALDMGVFRYLVKTPENLFEMSTRIREILDQWNQSRS